MNIQFHPEQFAMPISEVSYDDAKKQVLVHRDLVIYNFDDVKEFICRKLRDSSFTKSCDGYFQTKDGREYLIEFKNQTEADVPRRAVREKAYDSMFLLLLSFDKGKTVEQAAKNTTYIVVYNDHAKEDRGKNHYATSSSFDKIAAGFGTLAGVKGRKVRFGLGYLKGQLYRDVYTLDTEEFSKVFVDGVFQN